MDDGDLPSYDSINEDTTLQISKPDQTLTKYPPVTPDLKAIPASMGPPSKTSC